MKEEIQKQNVNIKSAGSGYIITIEDEFTCNDLAVSKEELKKLVLYGQIILKNEKSILRHKVSRPI